MSIMKIKPINKSIIFGVVTALLTTSLIIGVYLGITSTEKNQFLPPFEWDSSSLKTLSLQMNERSEYILATSIETNINDSSGMMVSYFNHSVHSIYSWYNTETEEWLLVINDYLNSSQDYDTIYKIQPDILSPFYLSLNADLQTIQNQVDISENYSEELALRESADLAIISIMITHAYQDGTLIIVEAFENTILVRLISFIAYHGDFNSWGVEIDPKAEFDDGRVKYDIFYKADIPEFLPNYTNATNAFLELFY